jgi:hypothetical protein
MRALYDYAAEDPEELTIVTGDLITQLESEDSQGWCKGVDKNGKVGFYAADYVEEVTDSTLDVGAPMAASALVEEVVAAPAEAVAAPVEDAGTYVELGASAEVGAAL